MEPQWLGAFAMRQAIIGLFSLLRLVPSHFILFGGPRGFWFGTKQQFHLTRLLYYFKPSFILLESAPSLTKIVVSQGEAIQPP